MNQYLVLSQVGLRIGFEETYMQFNTFFILTIYQ